MWLKYVLWFCRKSPKMTPLSCPFSKNQSAQTVNALVEFLYNIHFFLGHCTLIIILSCCRNWKLQKKKSGVALEKGQLTMVIQQTHLIHKVQVRWIVFFLIVLTDCEKRYFVSKIVLSFCKKKCSGDRENFWKSRLKAKNLRKFWHH